MQAERPQEEEQEALPLSSVLANKSAGVLIDLNEESYAIIGGQFDDNAGEEMEITLRVKARVLKKKDASAVQALASFSSSGPPSKKSRLTSQQISAPPTSSSLIDPSVELDTTGKKNIINVSDSLYLCDYSEKALALFGETKPIKEHLLLLGGKFNMALTDPKKYASKAPGWIFDMNAKGKVHAQLLEYATTGSFPAPVPAPVSSSPNPVISDDSVAGKVLLAHNCYIVPYSEKAFAVFGETKPIKDRLKLLKGRYNGSLTDSSIAGSPKAAGWIFPIKERDEVLKALGVGGKKGEGDGVVVSECKADDDEEDFDE